MKTGALAEAPRPRVLITAGPTAEDIDSVRYITNRSSGGMGVEIARAVLRAGGTPRLILGPAPVEPPGRVDVVKVRSARQMLDAVLADLAWCDALVMAAAVADYTPAEPISGKLKKGGGDLILRLKRTPDILREVMADPARPGKFIVGFSLDVDVNMDEGRRKLREKDMDMIVVNTTASFASPMINARILMRDGSLEQCGPLAKAALAARIVSSLPAL